MIYREKDSNFIKKRQSLLTFCLFSIFFFLFSNTLLSQDSIPVAKDLSEEKDLQFQNYFFKALTQKSIGNHQKAIENLEECNQILTNNTTVFFEFSKNYFSLNQTFLAKEYIKKALQNDAENIWMLNHYVSILKKERNFSEAISIQKKVITINPKQREGLVRLHIQNKEYTAALSLLNDLENEQLLNNKLRYLKKNLENRKSNTIKNTSIKNTALKEDLFDQFEKDKKYETLEKIFKKNKDNPTILLDYSKKGMALFPAQPFVYLINATTLNNQKKYKEAILALENGIDFVIDEVIETKFYKAFMEAYQGLGNTTKEEEFKKKLKKLKS